MGRSRIWGELPKGTVPKHHVVKVSQEGAHPTSGIYWTLRRKGLKPSERWQLLTQHLDLNQFGQDWLQLQQDNAECSLEGSQLTIWVSYAGIQSESFSPEYVSSLSLSCDLSWLFINILGHCNIVLGSSLAGFRNLIKLVFSCIPQLMSWRQDSLLSWSCYFVLPKISHATLIPVHPAQPKPKIRQ